MVIVFFLIKDGNKLSQGYLIRNQIINKFEIKTILLSLTFITQNGRQPELQDRQGKLPLYFSQLFLL